MTTCQIEEIKEYYVSVLSPVDNEWTHVVEERFSLEDANHMLSKLSKKHKRMKFRLDEVKPPVDNG